MTWLVKFFKSTIGMKVVMALTGIILVGFVLVHMLGNLQIFLGPKALNDYGAALQSNQALVWTVRLVLLASVGAHIYSAVVLSMRSAAARPDDYAQRQDIASTFASRTLRYGGVVLLLFIVYHLLHFTVGSVHPSFQRGNVYGNVVAGFQVLPVAVCYIIAQLALGLHLFHGVYSLTRTLGFADARFADLAKKASVAIAGAVTVGNISIPLAVLTHLVS